MTVGSKRKDFHITIGTHPPSDVTLESDLKLVKVALLYGDRVKLCSAASFTLLSTMAVTEMGMKQRIKLIESLASSITQNEQQMGNLLQGLHIYKELVRKKHLSGQEFLVRQRFERVFNDAWKSLKEEYQRMAESSGFNHIAQAVKSGLLEIQTFESPDTKDMVREFLDVLSHAISDGSTYPLFDDLVSDLLRSGIQEGKIKVSEFGVKRGRHTKLAAHLLERLPLFDNASIDEILDIRKELERPLIRFRSAMMKFSNDITSAAWDEEFAVEAEHVFYSEIEPAVLSIEDEVKSNKYITALLRKIADKPLILPAGSALAVGVSRLSDLPDLVTQGLGVSLATAPLVYDATREWKEKRLKAEQNHLFFYYRARKDLSK